jgi:hypothetical protein
MSKVGSAAGRLVMIGNYRPAVRGRKDLGSGRRLVGLTHRNGSHQFEARHGSESQAFQREPLVTSEHEVVALVAHELRHPSRRLSLPRSER